MSEPSLATPTSVSMLTEKDVGGADHNSPWPGVCNQSANYKALQWQALHISSQTVKCEEKKALSLAELPSYRSYSFGRCQTPAEILFADLFSVQAKDTHSRIPSSSPATPNPATAYLWFGQNGTKGRSCLPLDVVSHLNVWPFFFVLLIDSRG